MQTTSASLQNAIDPLKQEIIGHPVYQAINDLSSLKTFMEYHIFAVWDFMSLLKALQNNLTCTTIPWYPKGNANTRFLINEIVVGEESDVAPNGQRKSHFEMYLNAMEQAGANTAPIQQLLEALQSGFSLADAMEKARLPEAIRQFMSFTFRVIEEGKPHVQAAVFTFGREDLIPGMFMALVNDLKAQFPGTLDTFIYYLERHIEMDGDHHSHLAMEMTHELCGDDQGKWQEATEAAMQALQLRKALWQGVYEAVKQQTVVIS